MLKSLRKLLIKEYQLNETELLIKDVITNLLNQKDTEAITAPISLTYYIHNSRMQYYVKTDGFSIMITNHKFTFKEGMSVKFGEIITTIIKEYMEVNRKQFESEIFKNQLELLKNIKKSLEI